jgi:ArsR family transcriptional regulator, arsenate/arsenite/antimonite-responsive transcriptional repressor
MKNMTQLHNLARKFKLLSVDTRLKIIQCLMERSLCVGAIAKQLGVTQGAVSQHLRFLREADLVESVRDGFFIHYRVKRDTMNVWHSEIEGYLRELGSCDSGCHSEGEMKRCARKKTPVKKRAVRNPKT